jgi:putative Flp pilus-assembly TadE/G-like protein
MTGTSAQTGMSAATKVAVDPRRAGRGQVMVIFAGALLLLMMMTALVVDVSWYWVNSLRVQRAADAAALAGAVMLPNKASHAYALAYEEASKNGYPVGGGVFVTPLQDPGNDRRLAVTIRAPIGTFFMRVIGIESINVTRTSKAEFTLPVPMGSPQNYYGVGFYEGRVATTTNVPGNTDWQNPATPVAGGQWTNPDRVFTNNNSYATEATDNDAQQWSTFDLTGLIPASATIDGLEVRLTDVSITGGDDTNCRVTVNTSWNGGTTWSSNAPTLPLSALVNDDRTVGSNANTTVWGGHTWDRADFSNANFRVRLTWRDGIANCPAALGVQLDLLEVRVQFHTTTTTWTTQTLGVPDPSGGTLASQGFWGAIFTSGGWRENGDRYAPSKIGNGTGAPSGSANPNYDPNGYDYIIEVGGSGDVRLFDPVFCATGNNGHGGLFGAGDHWTSPTGNAHASNFTGGPVAITYTLYDTKGTPGNPLDDGSAVIAPLVYDPLGKTLGDFSGAFGTPDNDLDPDRQDCWNHPAHNQWVKLNTTPLNAGVYRLNVNTSLDPANMLTGAENLFSIWVSGSGGNARVYGSGRMAAYTNLDAGNQAFYFSQIEKVHAGKQLEIQLFDPGEASGNAYLRFLSPDGDSYDYATFDWVADDGRHGENVTSLQTAISGVGAQFNNRLVTITIDLPNTYGSAGLNPPGDITTEEGWWQIEYNINAANDTTTWQVTIRGNPVHLVLP